jgi:DNA-directed RNA polymerase subunit RPC12/RpoP
MINIKKSINKMLSNDRYSKNNQEAMVTVKATCYKCKNPIKLDLLAKDLATKGFNCPKCGFHYSEKIFKK